MSWPWSELGLPGPADLDAVKHAYAQRLKTTHPEDDPEGFQRLHTAYQAARRMARARRMDTAWPEEPAEPQEEGPEEEPSGNDRLTDQEETPPEPGDAGFDYEKLFEEGSAERGDAMRRRTEERLKAAQERRENDARLRQDAALSSEEAWNAAFTALLAVEVFYNEGASAEEWVLFLHSGTFLNAQYNMDFIFGLEDFLKEHPSLPDDIKRRIFLAYHFYRGKPSAGYLGLYRLLLNSYKSAGKTNKGIKQKLWANRKDYVIVIMILFVSVLITSISLPVSTRSSDSRSGSADTAYSDMESPTPNAGSTGTDRRIPLEGGNGDDVTSLHSLVISYAGEDFSGPYAISGKGTAENDLGTFDWMQCKGKDASGEDLIMNYYLSADGKSLYCIPDSKGDETVEMECTHTWRGISIYRCVEE